MSNEGHALSDTDVHKVRLAPLHQPHSAVTHVPPVGIGKTNQIQCLNQ